MNIFNRTIMILMLFVMIISSTVIVVNILTNLFQWSDIFNRILTFRQNTNVYLMASIFIAVIIVSIVILVLEFYRRKIKTTSVAAVERGKARISLRSVSQQIEEDLEDIDNISNLKVNVSPKSDGTIINVYAKLTKGIKVSEKMQEVINEVNEFATENLGLKVARTNFTATGFISKPELVTVDELEDEEEKNIPKEPKDIKTTDEDYN